MPALQKNTTTQIHKRTRHNFCRHVCCCFGKLPPAMHAHKHTQAHTHHKNRCTSSATGVELCHTVPVILNLCCETAAL